MSKKRQLAAIVFTDISDFTSMMDKDESKALTIRHKQRENITSNLKTFDGEYIKEIGDGDLLKFNSATDAVDFVLKLQGDISPEDNFSIRAAIHLGDVVIEGDDIFGSGVNIASRIHGFTSPGNTIISDAVYKEVKNKSKFLIESIGEKSIKGIDEAIHLYKISFKKAEEKVTAKKDVVYVEKSLISDLFERRVPQFIGIYCAISWGMIQFINWVVDRYLLSPHLVDLSFGIFVSMIPSILILSYFHGRPGKDKWNRIEKVIVPVNFIVAIGFLFISFYPKNLGAVTKEVTVEDLSGNEITKTIIKSEFRKSYIVFLFNDLNSDTTHSWLNSGTKIALTADLEQDSYSNTKTWKAHDVKQDMGFKAREYISLGDKQKISQRSLSKYFITGNYIVEGDTYTINVELYSTQNAKLVSSNQYQGNDFFSLIDLASHQIKLDMKIPLTYLENKTDLPIKDRLTDSMEALRYYTYYKNSVLYENEFKFLKKAIEYDEKFARVHMNLFYMYGREVDPNKAQENSELKQKHMDLALKYSSRLPDGRVFALRMDQIRFSKPDPEKEQKILEMWLELYPEDKVPLYIKSHFAEMNSDIDLAILTAKKILEVDPDEHTMLLKLARLYSSALGDYDTALQYFNQYAELYPTNPEAFEQIARQIYLPQLDYDKALDYMLKAETLGAGGVEFDISLIEMTSKLNNWESAIYVDKLDALTEDYDIDDLQGCSTILTLYMSITTHLEKRGQYRSAIPYYFEANTLVEKTQGPMMAAWQSIMLIGH